jgi:hypothetical protein
MKCCTHANKIFYQCKTNVPLLNVKCSTIQKQNVSLEKRMFRVVFLLKWISSRNYGVLQQTYEMEGVYFRAWGVGKNLIFFHIIISVQLSHSQSELDNEQAGPAPPPLPPPRHHRQAQRKPTAKKIPDFFNDHCLNCLSYDHEQLQQRQGLSTSLEKI